MQSLQLSIINYQFTFISHFSFINAAAWQMVNGKSIANGQWLMVNEPTQGGS